MFFFLFVCFGNLICALCPEFSKTIKTFGLSRPINIHVWTNLALKLIIILFVIG